MSRNTYEAVATDAIRHIDPRQFDTRLVSIDLTQTFSPPAKIRRVDYSDRSAPYDSAWIDFHVEGDHRSMVVRVDPESIVTYIVDEA